MISVEEKIQIFKQEIKDRFYDRKEKKLEEVRRELESEKAKEERYVDGELTRLKSRYEKLENRNVTKILNEARNQAKELSLILDNDLYRDFMTSLKDSLKKQLGSDAYRDFYARSVDQVRPYFELYPDFIVSTNRKDKKLFLDLSGLDPKRVRFEDLKKDNIGGFILMDGERKVRFDLTLLELIEENQRQIGFELNKKLEEA